ncbi:MAG: AMP-binding protein [Alkalimonas sp.]|nr:AMP-binding protein [Alkalimonas sp.]
MPDCLLDALPKIDQTALIIPGQSGQSAAWSYQQLAEAALALRAQQPDLQNKVVAINCSQLQQFLIELLAFDGYCSAMYLQPAPELAAPDRPVTPGQQTLWYLATSGTTGTPKWISHSLAELTKTVKSTAASGQLRWGLLYQPFRFAGLQVVLQSLLSGSCLVDASTGESEQRVQQLLNARVNALSGTPSLWRQLLFWPELPNLPLTQLTLGGEICDQPLLNQLQQCFPQARLRHIYASTEAGVGFSVTDGQAGFPRKYLDEGFKDLQFKVDDNQHLWLKRSTPFAATLQARLDSAGFLDTEDLVRVTSDRVYFLGRASGVINVGGNKVHPEQVEQRLLEVDGVAQARVYGKSSSILGQLILAELVPVPGADTDAVLQQVRLHCQQTLERYQTPYKFKWVNETKLAETGKLTRSTP